MYAGAMYPFIWFCAVVVVGLLGSTISTTAQGSVVINEIHCNPDIKTNLIEFVELYNSGSNTVNLGGWSFVEGVRYTFPAEASIAPDGYVVVAENTNFFQRSFGFVPFGPYADKLANDGETIELRDASGQLVDRVDYKLGFPWPTVGEPPGNSIELVHPSFDNDLGGNWRASSGGAGGSNPTTQLLLPDHSTWKYFKGLSEASTPTTAWRQLNFNDTNWLSGGTPIGFGETFITNSGTVLGDMNGAYSSVFFRKVFMVTNAAQFTRLILEAQYDDGFKAWINGINVIDGQANMTAGEVAYNGTASSAIENLNFVIFNVANILVSGTNLLAIQAHNSSLSGSSDFFLDVRLSGQTGGSTNVLPPTPGRRNSVFANNLPPQIRQVEHDPEQPVAGQSVKIRAKVTDPEGVTNVVLQYQIVDPGSYIEITDAAYTNNWVSVTMNDAGSGGDMAAGDDVYTATLPGSLQVHRRLVRYRMIANDGTGNSVRVPYGNDPQPNFAYFVYNGVPEWRGAIQPGAAAPNGTVLTYGTNVMGRLPVYHLISKKTAVETATWFERYGGDLYKWTGTLVYDGKVYDHIHYRARGGVWRYSMVKNMWKFDLNRGHYFEARDNYGQQYDTPMNKVNLGACIQQGDFNHRGEQGMFEAVGFKMFQLADGDSPNTAFVTFRIIDEAAEYGPSQYDGDFWGLYLLIENEDGRFLDEHELPDGNLYKMESGTGPSGAAGELKNQGPTSVTDYSDLISFRNTYLNTTPTEAWWRTNLDLQKYYGYQAIVQGIHHYDIADGKNYFYYRNPETGLWSVEAWDLDLTWADNMYRSGLTGGDEPFKSRVLAVPMLNREYQNRLREVQDLLFNSDQGFRLIDEFAAMIDDPNTNVLSIVDADRAQWDYNPKMNDSTYTPNLGKAGTGRFYQFPGESATNAGLRGSFPATVRVMKNYINYRNNLVLNPLAADSAIPATPSVTPTGPTNFPLNRLTFRALNYSGSNPFAARKWRLGEITASNAPPFNPAQPGKYEIVPAWESGEITDINNLDITIPSSVVKAGETYRVRCRVKDNTGRWSRWSAPIQFVCGPPDSAAALLASLRISELMYHAPLGSEFDFIELHHAGGPLPLDLNGAKFTQGIDYTFGPGTIIPAGGYLLLVKTTNIAAFRAHYGISPDLSIVGPYGGNFDNGGEQVTLRTSAGGTDIASFEYSDGRGWPLSADGSGHSLVPLDSAGDGQKSGALSYGGNWRASTYMKGSPGAADPSPPRSIVLNELAAHTDFTNELDSNDWVELYNATTNDLPLGPNWFLSDDGTNLTKWMIPPGTMVPAQGFASFDEQTGFHNPTNIGFGLSKAGEQLFLSYLPGTAEDRVVDSIAFKGQENDWALGRAPDGGEFWYGLTPRTRGSNNAAPLPHVVIAELMYHPPDIAGTNDNGLDEYIEVFNPAPGSVALFNTNGPWRIDGGVSFSLPTNFTMPPMSYLLIVNFSPTNTAQSNAFRALYRITNSVTLLGPYAGGKLPNSSARVALEKPQAPDGLADPLSWIIVDEVIYADQSPWQLAADGFGPSLHRQDMLQHGCDPANWLAAAPTPGGSYGGGVPPAITEQPSPPFQTLPAGVTVTYSVGAAGTSPLSFLWRFNGNPIPYATNATLVLNNVQPVNSGEYSVMVLNPAGSALSATVGLAVTTPPQISAHPQSQSVLPGSTVTFTVSATGSGLLRYQWRLNGTDIMGATNSNFSINNVQTNHQGTYTVLISDVNGSVISNPATLIVLVPPFYIRQPQDQIVLAGDTVTFSVTVGGTEPFGYRWRRDGLSFVPFPSGPSITITNAPLSYHGSKFSAVVTNAANLTGVLSSNGVLYVLADTDGDRMPDEWEIAHGLNYTNVTDGTNDLDGDRMVNRDEYMAGTDPQDPQSYLRIETITPDFNSTATVQLTFLAVTNRTYTIQYRDSMLPVPWNHLADIDAAPTNRMVQVIDQPGANIVGRFYRLLTPRVN